MLVRRRYRVLIVIYRNQRNELKLFSAIYEGGLNQFFSLCVLVLFKMRQQDFILERCLMRYIRMPSTYSIASSSCSMLNHVNYSLFTMDAINTSDLLALSKRRACIGKKEKRTPIL